MASFAAAMAVSTRLYFPAESERTTAIYVTDVQGPGLYGNIV
jgi:hypothetical protein